MADQRRKNPIFRAKNLSFLICFAVFLVFSGLSAGTDVLERMDLKIQDFFFFLKGFDTSELVQDRVVRAQVNPKVSPAINIVAIDDRSLSRLGRWPFPRYVIGDFVNAFSRITDQSSRESALFLDIFFIEPDSQPVHDAVLQSSLAENGRVFLETVMELRAADVQDPFLERYRRIGSSLGTITEVTGGWDRMPGYLSMAPPISPLGSVVRGFGHANYQKDFDNIYRRQPLVAKHSELIEEYLISETPRQPEVDESQFYRMEWVDTIGGIRNIPLGLSDDEWLKTLDHIRSQAPPLYFDEDGDGEPDRTDYVVRLYKDRFLPAITLSLALNYFHKTFDDITIEIGNEIVIPGPEVLNPDTGLLEPYSLLLRPAQVDEEGNRIQEALWEPVPEIRIPIDANGAMRINYQGGASQPQGTQTYPLRSFYAYAQRAPELNGRWPRTKNMANKIVMVGPFSQGMADDQKPSPYGLMYGIEIHANALNTILMNDFLNPVTPWLYWTLFGFAVILTALYAGRLKPLWGLLITIGQVLVWFVFSYISFVYWNRVLPAAPMLIAIPVSYILVLLYRIVTEEKDKKRIRSTFGKYVSPQVVEKILSHPPELGGEEKELTVFFSDIRGFTTLSEKLEPRVLVELLNQYLSAMTDVILKNQGTLDKYEGDAIMAFWGAPVSLEKHAYLACKTAVEQVRALEALKREWPRDFQFDIGIGINTGMMTVGNMGSAMRMDYTLIGDHVNLGARLEGANKTYKTAIIISENTYEKVKDSVIVRELDRIRVKGKRKPVLIYELIDCL